MTIGKDNCLCKYLIDPLSLTFVFWKLSYNPGQFVGIQVNIQNMTESLWVQVTPSSKHPCWR